MSLVVISPRKNVQLAQHVPQHPKIIRNCSRIFQQNQINSSVKGDTSLEMNKLKKSTHGDERRKSGFRVHLHRPSCWLRLLCCCCSCPAFRNCPTGPPGLLSIAIHHVFFFFKIKNSTKNPGKIEKLTRRGLDERRQNSGSRRIRTPVAGGKMQPHRTVQWEPQI